MGQEVLSIANQELGDGYFKSVLNHLKPYPATSYCIFDGQKLIGFNLSYQCSLGQFFYDTQSTLPLKLPLESKIMVVKTMVIQAGYQRKGYGTQLLQYLIDAIDSSEIETMLALGWKSDDCVNIQHMMDTFEFTELCELPEFWKADSVKYGYQCPTCGHPCKCPAIIYSKLLLDSNL
jgi:GNAT superfamily N-acetyltransferase